MPPISLGSVVIANECIIKTNISKYNGDIFAIIKYKMHMN